MYYCYSGIRREQKPSLQRRNVDLNLCKKTITDIMRIDIIYLLESDLWVVEFEKSFHHALCWRLGGDGHTQMDCTAAMLES